MYVEIYLFVFVQWQVSKMLEESLSSKIVDLYKIPIHHYFWDWIKNREKRSHCWFFYIKKKFLSGFVLKNLFTWLFSDKFLSTCFCFFSEKCRKRLRKIFLQQI